MTKIARGLSLAGAVLVFSSCKDAIQPTLPSADPLASVSVASPAGSSRYIVVFRHGVADIAGTARSLAAAHGARLIHTYDVVLHGMNIELPDAAVAALRTAPEVLSITREVPGQLSGSQTPATWGLDRVDQRSLPLNNTYNYATDGTGVTIYIIDSGINPSHPDFGGRASIGFDATGGTGADCLGHGTHVAGTAAGSTYGVAKNATVIAVKVSAGCTDQVYPGDVISGINWVTGHKAPVSVANLSLGVPLNANLDSALVQSMRTGITYVAAAGNCIVNGAGGCYQGPYDACTISPAHTAGVITVGATTQTDAASYFTNYGGCIALNAPGSDVVSDNWTGGLPVTESGTSMASPHVAGAAALYLSAFPSATPAEVRAALRQQATTGKITGLRSGTPNLLLYTGITNSKLFAATVYGPSDLYAYQQCTWASTPTGGKPPYTYTWAVQSWSGGQQTGTWVPPVASSQNFSTTLYGNNSFDTGILTFGVADANGVALWLTKPIYWHFGGGSCYGYTTTAAS